MHNYLNMRNAQMIINTCKLLPFLKISRTHACKNGPFFLISRIRASHWKNSPFFAKMGTSAVYVLVGSGGDGERIEWLRLITDTWNVQNGACWESDVANEI